MLPTSSQPKLSLLQHYLRGGWCPSLPYTCRSLLFTLGGFSVIPRSYITSYFHPPSCYMSMGRCVVLPMLLLHDSVWRRTCEC